PIVLGQTFIFTPMIHARIAWTVADSAIVQAIDVPQPGGGTDTQRVVYDNVRAHRIRLAPGFELRYQRLQLSAAYMFDVAGGPGGLPGEPYSAYAAKQWRIDIAV